MIRLSSFCLALLLLSNLAAQRHPAYRLYNGQGKSVRYDRMIRDFVRDADIVLFGELHDDPIGHWLQQEVARDVYAQRPLIMGAEMFETDNQEALTDYVRGRIEPDTFAARARLWPNYETDYAPLVEFAREENINFVASNVPRRYAQMVYRGGFEALDTLPEAEKAWIAPLPIAYDPDLPGYQAMLDMMPAGHGGETFPMAQALKDATMAHRILQWWEEEHLLLHFNGAYHSENYEGILWYLQRDRPELTYRTITTVRQADISQLAEENKGKADYIIVVPDNMTTTY